MNNNSINIKIGDIPSENEVKVKKKKYHVAIIILIVLGSLFIISGMLLVVWKLKVEEKNEIINGYEEVDNNDGDSIPKEIYTTALDLASKNFDLSSIFKTGSLSYVTSNNDNRYAKVNDERYDSYQDLKNDVEKTYTKEFADQLLNNNPVYLEENGEFVIDLQNVSIANVFAGKTNENVEVKNYTDTSFEIIYKLDVYMDKEKTIIEERQYTLKAVKENDVWKLDKMY